jgi:hypothetical protein
MTYREKGYRDYGLNEQDVENVIRFCRKNTNESNKKVFECSFKANSAIGADLYYSLSQDVSFERLDAIKSIAYSKSDFYGYRRYCVFLLYKEMYT